MVNGALFILVKRPGRHTEGPGPQRPQSMRGRCSEASSAHLIICPPPWTFFLFPSHHCCLRAGNIQKGHLSAELKKTLRPFDSFHCLLSTCHCPRVSDYLLCVLNSSRADVSVYPHLSVGEHTCAAGFPHCSLLPRLLPGVGMWLMLRWHWPCLPEEAHCHPPHPMYSCSKPTRACE